MEQTWVFRMPAWRAVEPCRASATHNLKDCLPRDSVTQVIFDSSFWLTTHIIQLTIKFCLFYHWKSSHTQYPSSFYSFHHYPRYGLIPSALIIVHVSPPLTDPSDFSLFISNSSSHESWICHCSETSIWPWHLLTHKDRWSHIANKMKPQLTALFNTPVSTLY